MHTFESRSDSYPAAQMHADIEAALLEDLQPETLEAWRSISEWSDGGHKPMVRPCESGLKLCVADKLFRDEPLIDAAFSDPASLARMLTLISNRAHTDALELDGLTDDDGLVFSTPLRVALTALADAPPMMHKVNGRTVQVPHVIRRYRQLMGFVDTRMEAILGSELER